MSCNAIYCQHFPEGTVIHCSNQEYLSTNKENELANFLEQSAAMGYGKCFRCLALIQRILDTKQKGQIVSRGLWDSFSKRHPHLTLIYSKKL